MIRDQRILWLLFYGDTFGGKDRVSIGVPERFVDRLPASPDQDPLTRPLVDAIQVVQDYLQQNPRWVAIFSIPQRLSGSRSAEEYVRARGWRPLEKQEKESIQEIMDLPLGEWASVDTPMYSTLAPMEERPRETDLSAVAREFKDRTGLEVYPASSALSASEESLKSYEAWLREREQPVLRAVSMMLPLFGMRSCDRTIRSQTSERWTCALPAVALVHDAVVVTRNTRDFWARAGASN